MIAGHGSSGVGAKELEVLDWKELTTDAEIDDFLTLFGGFHDGYIKEAYMWGGPYVDSELCATYESRTHYRILFQRQYKSPSAVEMVFEGLALLRRQPAPPGYDDVIFDAWIYRDDGLIVWADAPPEETAKNLIAAQRLWWRDASEWMGPDLRIGRGWDREGQDNQ